MWLAIVVLAGCCQAVKLWTSGTCPFAQRAQIALEEAGVAYDVELVDLQAKSTAFENVYASANPGARARVPVLEVGNFRLVESLPMTEYICEKWAPALLAKDAEGRAAQRLAVEAHPFGSFVELLRRSEDPIELAEAVSAFGASLSHFDALLGAYGVEAGDFGWAHACIAPFVQRCCALLPAFVDVDVLMACDLRGAHRVRTFIETCLARPSVVATGLSEEQIVAQTILRRMGSRGNT